MMTRSLSRKAPQIFVATRRTCRVWETAPGHLITHTFCALSRYGVIWEDRSTCDWTNHNHFVTGPPYGRTATAVVVPALQASARRYLSVPPERIPLPEDD